MADKIKGEVKFFNDFKGFGFIAGEDGKEYFVHSTGLKEGTKINDGDKVVFEIEQGDKGPKAANVEKDTSE
ncbi:MAG: cold shock domain-containing protein [Candidatus Aenigmarchaeota archaeon]|nr:cold shock domain-containing protein [Candidatus Aenigmarchaeota archaeon]